MFHLADRGTSMPESSQTLVVAIFTLPGVLGYFAFASIYRREVGDNFEKASLVAIFDLSAIIILSFFHDVSSLSAAAQAKLTYSAIETFVTNLLLPLSLISVVIAVVAAFFFNKGWLQSALVSAGITNKTSYSSVLADVICSYPDCYLKFRLKSGGYVIGHPRKFSLHGKEDCIFLENAARRPPRPAPGANQPAEVPIDGQGILILKFDDVSVVEVL
jgi:hypothetical protein